MALTKNDLVQLGKIAMSANPSAPTAYSFNGASLTYSAVSETLREELNALASTHAMYRENKNLIFSIMEEILEIKEQFHIKNVIVTHLEEDWGKSYDDYAELEKEYDGIRFAYDGMEVEL